MKNTLRESVTLRKVDNLNKQNFWDVAKELCPATTASFCEWIDRYKKNQFFCPEWNGVLDNWAVIGLETMGGVFSLKFHDIPIEMQIGIVNRFFTEVYGNVDFTPLMMGRHNWLSIEGWLDVVCDMFEFVEHVINPRPDRLWDVPPLSVNNVGILLGNGKVG